jgi:hypothetical protein
MAKHISFEKKETQVAAQGSSLPLHIRRCRKIWFQNHRWQQKKIQKPKITVNLRLIFLLLPSYITPVKHRPT